MHVRSPDSGYLPTLDGWRAIAITLVLFAHAAPFSGRWTLLDPLRNQGSLGVDVFFAISGILICTRLLWEEEQSGRISLRSFYIRRTCRIFPPAYLFLAALAMLAVARVLPMDWPAWASAVAFLRNYFTCFVLDTLNGRFTSHFWSLAIEEHFYLLLPALLVVFPRRRKLVLSGLILAVFAWLCLYLKTTPVAARDLFWERRTDLRLNSLMFPALLALWLQRPRARAVIARLTHPVILATLVVVLLAGQYLRHHSPATPPSLSPVTSLPAIPVPSPPQPWQSFSKDPTLHLFAVFVVPYIFPFLLLGTMLHPTTLPARILEWTPLRMFGRLSYSIYIWQQLFWVGGPERYRGWPIAHFQRPLPALLLTALCAAASYFLVEKPFIRLGHRLTASRPVPLLHPATTP